MSKRNGLAFYTNNQLLWSIKPGYLVWQSRLHCSLGLPMSSCLQPIMTQKINLNQTEFLKSAAHITQCPPDKGIEIAFVGRSNSGKSTAINTLVGRNRLAKTSKTPGRTQLINFFQVDEDRRLVDLPGYGYAKVPERAQRQMGDLLGSYLNNRQSLYGIILLMDVRHPLSSSDKKLLDLIGDCELAVHIMLTKCDKLKRGASNNALLKVRQELTHYKNISVQTFSSLKRIGLEEAQQKLDQWFSFDE
jgi:GTP-binding protein